MSDGLDRFRLALIVQELAGLPAPPKLRGRPRAHRSSERLVALACGRSGPSGAGLSRLRCIFVDAVVVIGLRVAAGAFWRLGPRSAIALVGKHVRELDEPHTDVAGYVTSSPKEEQVIRLSLLLRLLQRHREAFELLDRRLRSGLPSARSRALLASFLERAGEKKAAALLAPSAADRSEPDSDIGSRRHEARLRYGIVILTMFDSDVFRSSLRSLARSDFDGRIVVVEDAHQPEETCREFCDDLAVGYVKQQRWEGSAAAMNAGIAALPADTDLLVFAHNDILWPPGWFRSLDRAWDGAFDSGRLGILSLGYLQFKRSKDPAMLTLFEQGRYEDLRWLLSAMREVPELQARVQDSRVQTGDLFGLARDPWNDWAPDLRFMTGRFSVAASFPTEMWRTLGGFDVSMPYGFDVELQRYCLASRRLMLFAGNPPLIHLASSDTRTLAPAQRAEFDEKIRQTYESFERKYGWQLEHFLNVYFSETAFVYHDEIIRAANALRFDQADFVFDDFDARLRARTLANCELTWCRSRVGCKYTAPPALPRA